jgi:hypothetical protein
MSEYIPNRNKGHNGNDLSGNGCQINFDELLIVIQTAHKNKVDELRQLLSDTHWADSYADNRYHHHTRGESIEVIGGQVARLSRMLWMLQGMNGNESRLSNFHWVFDSLISSPKPLDDSDDSKPLCEKIGCAQIVEEGGDAWLLPGVCVCGRWANE